MLGNDKDMYKKRARIGDWEYGGKVGGCSCDFK